MNKEAINAAYDVPESFYQAVKPYLRGESFEDPKQLVGLWEKTLEYRRNFPEYEESIAELVFSTEASSDLINDNGLYEAVHIELGTLEVRAASETDQSREEGWQEIERLVAEARDKIENS